MQFQAQTGLAGTVLGDMHHTRREHLIGTALWAREVVDSLSRHGAEISHSLAALIVAAAEVHDSGYPFGSHMGERALNVAGAITEQKQLSGYHHEKMAIELIGRNDSQLGQLLRRELGADAAELIAPFIYSPVREQAQHRDAPHAWAYPLVSGPFDLDGADYVIRDRLHLKGTRPLRPEDLIDAYRVVDGKLALRSRALADVGLFFATMFTNYHLIWQEDVRAVETLWSTMVQRAIVAHFDRSATTPPIIPLNSPLAQLLEKGMAIDTTAFLRLDDRTINRLIPQWQHARDPALAKLAGRYQQQDWPVAVALRHGIDARDLEVLLDEMRDLAVRGGFHREEVTIDTPRHVTLKPEEMSLLHILQESGDAPGTLCSWDAYTNDSPADERIISAYNAEQGHKRLFVPKALLSQALDMVAQRRMRLKDERSDL